MTVLFLSKSKASKIIELLFEYGHKSPIIILGL